MRAARGRARKGLITCGYATPSLLLRIRELSIHHSPVYIVFVRCRYIRVRWLNKRSGFSCWSKSSCPVGRPGNASATWHRRPPRRVETTAAGGRAPKASRRAACLPLARPRPDPDPMSAVVAVAVRPLNVPTTRSRATRRGETGGQVASGVRRQPCSASGPSPI